MTSYFPQYQDPSPMLCQQIEFYYSDHNLVKDIYLRQRMDVEGWVPCAMLFEFPRVKQMCYGIEFLLAACENSKLIEVSHEHEKIRLRQGWKKWLYPGQDGNMGVPLYTKFPRAASPMILQQHALEKEVIQVNSSFSSSSSSDNDSEPAGSEPASPTSSAPSTPTRDSLKMSLSANAAEWSPANFA